MKISTYIMAGLFSLALLSPSVTMAAQPVSNPQTVTIATPASFNDAQVKQIQKIVHDYLVQNPQVLVEASQAYQDQEAAKAKSKTHQALVKNAKALFTTTNSPTVGNLQGDVTIVEFLDYQCTHCREMSNIMATLLKTEPNVRFVIRDLPIFGGSSKFGAKASVAAIKQGPQKYIAFHKGLLEVELPLTDAKVLEVAKNAGLNLPQLQADMKDKANDAQINDNFKMAQELGLLGTPAFIIANRQGTRFEYVPGTVSVDSLKQTIAKVRK